MKIWYRPNKTWKIYLKSTNQNQNNIKNVNLVPKRWKSAKSLLAWTKIIQKIVRRPIQTAIPERQIEWDRTTWSCLQDWLRKNLPWASSSMSTHLLLTTHLLNRWMTRRAITVSIHIQLYIDGLTSCSDRAVFFLDIREGRVHMSVLRCCPQRGLLSPLIWNMVADCLLNWLGNCNCFVQDFADDVVILINRKLLSTICVLMQRALNCVKNGVVK
jgi:hypothetical protein